MRVIIAGGGTYGHIAPGLAIFHEFVKRGDEVIYICSPRDTEYEKIKELDDKVKVIPVTPFKRYDLPAKITFGFNFLRGILKSRKIIRKFKPDVFVGVGGYVAGAPLMILRKNKKIKKVILEQNTLPGAVNRYFSRYVDLNILTFEKSKKWIKGKSVILGNPVILDNSPENKQKGKDYFNVKNGEFVLSIIGGSAGAKIINDKIFAIIDKLKNITVIWSTGPKHYEEIKTKCADKSNVKIYPFINNMEQLYPITKLVVARAGATSISELCYMGVPAILIPYKWSSENHQVHNAQFVVDGGGGEMIEEDDLTQEKLFERINSYVSNPDLLNKMSLNIKGLFDVDVKKLVVDKIKEIV